MWCKRSGFGYFRVFYQLFPILSPSLNLQGVMQVSVLYECGVCPSIVFLKLSRTWCCFLTEILFSSRVVRVSYVQGSNCKIDHVTFSHQMYPYVL